MIFNLAKGALSIMSLQNRQISLKILGAVGQFFSFNVRDFLEKGNFVSSTIAGWPISKKKFTRVR